MGSEMCIRDRHLAIENENHTCVVALVEKGASINSLVGGWKALDHAVDISIDGTIQTGGKPGDEPIETITYLLERGADKRSALNLAKKYENEKIVQILENR